MLFDDVFVGVYIFVFVNECGRLGFGIIIYVVKEE